MKQAGHITVTRLHLVDPCLLIESAKVNVACRTQQAAIDNFHKAILWTKAFIGRKE